MKILVTGGAGYIGSHTVVELMNSNYTPIIVDDFRNSNESVIDRIEKITGTKPICYNVDCLDQIKMDEIFEKENPEGIIHFAAYKAVGESVDKPVEYFENNIGSLAIILKLAKKHDVNSVVFSSSCTVYGEPDHIPVTEKSAIKEATSPYGYTKQVCERLITDYCISNNKVSAVLLRYFNPIGAHPSALIGELPIGVPNNLVPYITQTAIGIRESLTINGDTYDTPDGTCIRDYIHVSDLANAHVASLQHLKNSSEGLYTFNVGTGKGSSVLEVVNAFEKVSEKSLNYRIGPKRQGDIESVFSNNDKITSEIGWEPKYSLEEALLHSWNWQQTLDRN